LVPLPAAAVLRSEEHEETGLPDKNEKKKYKKNVLLLEVLEVYWEKGLNMINHP
jgi:hypothetical protein